MATARRLFVQRPLHEAHSEPQASTPPSVATPHTFPLEAEEQHYARNVLRLGDGDGVTLIDGHGHLAEAKLFAASKKELGARATTPFTQAQSLVGAPEVTIACPLPKGDRADWMAEKLAEFGVYAWVWLVCERSVVLPKGAAKPQRLERLMRAAARQARHGRVPKLVGPTSLAEYLGRAELKSSALRYVADGLGKGALPTVSQAEDLRRHVIIGPEVGLTDDELQAAQRAGYGRLCLGPHVLRVETAAMACAVILGQPASLGMHQGER